MFKRGGILNKIVSPICSFIWNVSEDYNLPLGRLAPYVFGGCLWSWPKKVREKK